MLFFAQYDIKTDRFVVHTQGEVMSCSQWMIEFPCGLRTCIKQQEMDVVKDVCHTLITNKCQLFMHS